LHYYQQEQCRRGEIKVSANVSDNQIRSTTTQAHFSSIFPFFPPHGDDGLVIVARHQEELVKEQMN